MAGTFPRFRLYASDGVSLIYEFENVTEWDNSPFLDPQTYTEHVSLRGQGSIVSEGSNEAFDFKLNFILQCEDYESLVAKMSVVPSTVVFNTKYILKIDLTSGGSTKDLKVKRLQSVLFPSTTQRKVTSFQEGEIVFRVDCWS